MKYSIIIFIINFIQTSNKQNKKKKNKKKLCKNALAKRDFYYYT